MTSYDRVGESKYALVGLVNGGNEETLCRLGPELPDWVYPYLYELIRPRTWKKATFQGHRAGSKVLTSIFEGGSPYEEAA